MSSTYHDIFRSVLSDPTDDTVRLVLADYLDERGDVESAARAEYIRVSVEMAKYGDPALCEVTGRTTAFGGWVNNCPCPVCRLRATEAELDATSYLNRWGHAAVVSVALSHAAIGDDAPLDTRRHAASPGVVWQRGFPHTLAIGVEDFMENAGELFKAAPWERVRLSDRTPQFAAAPYSWWFFYPSPTWATRREKFVIPDELEVLRCPSRKPGSAYFPDEDAAHEALSVACVRFGRELAGLTPLAIATSPQPVPA